ncbi:MAG: adenylate/guanylate cyclase domain-containing protein [Chlamydiales bacterium]|nr:adenylate/guanylate cyclase domain-containing protein [Chlamydiales bacterium]
MRTKLFIWIGSLLLLATILSCLIPKYIISTDLNTMIYSFRRHVHHELEIEGQMKEKNFENILGTQNLILSRNLLYLYKEFASSKNFQPENDDKALWKEATKIFDLNPDINFLQLSQADKILFSTPTKMNTSIDVETYYNNNLPDHGAPPIAKGLLFLNTFHDILPSKVMKITETSDKKPIFLTLGESLLPSILNILPTPSSLAIFLTKDATFLFAIDASGNIVKESFFKEISYTTLFNEPFGTLQIETSKYHYYKLGQLEKPPFQVLILSPDSIKSLYYFEDRMIQQMQTTGFKLFLQIFALGVLILGAALIVLAILSKKITKPISMITLAAEEILEGHYHDLHLPKIENSNDEIAILTSSFSRMISGLQAKEKIRGLLDKVVSKEIAAEILKDGVQLGGEMKHATILFSDIRGYTHLTENTDPKIIIKYLNYYMTEMSKIVEEEGGVIDKYVGDEIMALYGVPLDIKNAADKAVKTAILMMEKLVDINIIRKEGNRPPLKIGIGIHSGEVIAGNMGANTRLNYTVLGATVNLANRLCAAAEPMQIRISKETLESLTIKDSLVIEELPAIIYKGFSNPLVTYAIKGYKYS